MCAEGSGGGGKDWGARGGRPGPSPPARRARGPCPPPRPHIIFMLELARRVGGADACARLAGHDSISLLCFLVLPLPRLQRNSTRQKRTTPRKER